MLSNRPANWIIIAWCRSCSVYTICTNRCDRSLSLDYCVLFLPIVRSWWFWPSSPWSLHTFRRTSYYFLSWLYRFLFTISAWVWSCVLANDVSAPLRQSPSLRRRYWAMPWCGRGTLRDSRRVCVTIERRTIRPANYSAATEVRRYYRRNWSSAYPCRSFRHPFRTDRRRPNGRCLPPHGSLWQ